MNPLPYDQWVDQALRGVIRQALTHVAEKGFTQDHHYYITLHLGVRGVVVPDVVRTQHPDGLTIVLQHQCKDLEVGEESFSVTLSFAGKPARITVPFAAIVNFVDPSVNFQIPLPVRSEIEKDVTDQPAKKQQTLQKISDEKEKSSDADNSDINSDINKVVSLDAFRQKGL